MAIVTFECDTCKRSINKPQNKAGLEIISGCVITSGCKGKLHKIGFSADHVAGQPPTAVEGLTDWNQRKIVYTHNQNTLSDRWKIVHQLNNHPTIQMQIETSGSEELVEIQPDEIEYEDNNTVILHLTSRSVGIAQCIVISSTTVPFTEADEAIAQSLQLTTANELTIATLNNDTNIDVELTFVAPANLQPIYSETYTFDNTPGNNSTWKVGITNRVLIKGKLYTLRSTAIDPNVLVQNGIENGTPFYVSAVNGVENHDVNSIFVLLTNPPYDKVDKEFNQVIDILSADATNAANSFFFSKNELHANVDIKENVYPPVVLTNA